MRHLTGVWPVALTLDTTVTDVDPDRALALTTESRLLGDVRTRLDLRPTGQGTEVALTREVLGGVRRLVPAALKRPLLQAWADDCLMRLSFLAERR